MNPRRGRLASIPKAGYRADLGIHVHSAWEANYARFLSFLKSRREIRDWAYEPVRFDFPLRRGVVSYTPDFQITERDGTVAYHEVKGYMDDRSRTKLARMRKYHPSVTVHVIDRTAYQEIEKKMAGAIPGWEYPLPRKIGRPW
jgi:hypothetical protein